VEEGRRREKRRRRRTRGEEEKYEETTPFMYTTATQTCNKYGRDRQPC